MLVVHQSPGVIRVVIDLRMNIWNKSFFSPMIGQIGFVSCERIGHFQLTPPTPTPPPPPSKKIKLLSSGLEIRRRIVVGFPNPFAPGSDIQILSVGEPCDEIVILSVFSPLHTFRLCGSELVLFTRATSRSADQGGDVVHQAAKPHNLSFHNLTFSYYHAYWHALIEQAQRHILSFYHLTFFYCHAALSGCANNDHRT